METIQLLLLMEMYKKLLLTDANQTIATPEIFYSSWNLVKFSATTKLSSIREEFTALHYFYNILQALTKLQASLLKLSNKSVKFSAASLLRSRGLREWAWAPWTVPSTRSARGRGRSPRRRYPRRSSPAGRSPPAARAPPVARPPAKSRISMAINSWVMLSYQASC